MLKQTKIVKAPSHSVARLSLSVWWISVTGGKNKYKIILPILFFSLYLLLPYSHINSFGMHMRWEGGRERERGMRDTLSCFNLFPFISQTAVVLLILLLLLWLKLMQCRLVIIINFVSYFLFFRLGTLECSWMMNHLNWVLKKNNKWFKLLLRGRSKNKLSS